MLLSTTYVLFWKHGYFFSLEIFVIIGFLSKVFDKHGYLILLDIASLGSSFYNVFLEIDMLVWWNFLYLFLAFFPFSGGFDLDHNFFF